MITSQSIHIVLRNLIRKEIPIDYHMGGVTLHLHCIYCISLQACVIRSSLHGTASTAGMLLCIASAMELWVYLCCLSPTKMNGAVGIHVTICGHGYN